MWRENVQLNSPKNGSGESCVTTSDTVWTNLVIKLDTQSMPMKSLKKFGKITLAWNGSASRTLSKLWRQTRKVGTDSSKTTENYTSDAVKVITKNSNIWWKA